MVSPFNRHSFEVATEYMDKVATKIDALRVRPMQDAVAQRIEANIANLAKALLNQMDDYQRRYYEVLKEDAGPVEDHTLSMQQLGVTPR